MVRASDVRRRWSWVLALAIILAALPGCGRTYACHVGARSPERAVTTLLEAAAESNENLACTVVTELSVDLDANLAEIGDFVTQAGGLDNLSVWEDKEQRMGSGGVVVVRTAGSNASMEFDTHQSGGRYTVTVGDPEPVEDDDAADPRPRVVLPTQPAASTP